MTEFEQQLQQIVTRNWPLNKMQERFANVYAQAVSMVEADVNVQVPVSGAPSTGTNPACTLQTARWKGSPGPKPLSPNASCSS